MYSHTLIAFPQILFTSFSSRVSILTRNIDTGFLYVHVSVCPMLAYCRSDCIYRQKFYTIW